MTITENELQIAAKKYLDGKFAGDVLKVQTTRAGLLATIAGAKILLVRQAGQEPLDFILLNGADLYHFSQLIVDGTLKTNLCRLQPAIKDFIED